MTSSLPLLWTAVGENDNLVAVIHPQSIGSNHRLSIPLYDSVSGSLQSTLTTSLPSEVVVKKLLFVSSQYVCVLLNTSTIVVWSVTRGVVIHSIQVQDAAAALDISNNGNDDATLFVLVSKHEKLYIYEYSLETGKVVRKIKSGMHVGSEKIKKNDCSMAVSSKYVAIRQADKLRVLSLETGSKVAKLKVSGGGDGGAMCMEESNLAVVTSTGVVLYKIGEDSGAETVATIFSASQQPITYVEIKDNLLLVRTTTSTFVYEWPMTSTKDPLKPIASLVCQDGVDAANVSFSTDNDEQLVTVLYSPVKGIHVQLLSYKSNKDKEIVIGFPTDNDDNEEKAEDKTTLKRRQPSSATTTLGPGQAGGEALHASDRSSKKPRLEDEEQDVSIAQRLQQLAQEMTNNDDDDDDKQEEAPTKFNKKKATTESLANLLSQALSSNDDAMLEVCLGVRDKRTITTSIQELDGELVGRLLTKLTFRLSHKPNRAAELSMWISLVLSSGKVQDVQQLRPLRNLLQERVDSFPHLLQLEGRLSVLAAMK